MGPADSLHASALYSEYKDVIYFTNIEKIPYDLLMHSSDPLTNWGAGFWHFSNRNWHEVLALDVRLDLCDSGVRDIVFVVFKQRLQEL